MGRQIRQQVVEQLQKNEWVRAHSLSQELSVSRQYVHRVINQLMEEGLVVKRGQAPHVEYAFAGESTKAANPGVVIWLTGLSGSGKSTLANEIRKILTNTNNQVAIVDEHALRLGINKDLSLHAKDQSEAVRRMGEVAKILSRQVDVVVVAAVSAFAADRNTVRSLFEQERFIEVFVDCPIEVCKKRDPKGYYSKYEQGLISQVPGVDLPYERPLMAELVVDADMQQPADLAQEIVDAAL